MKVQTCVGRNLDDAMNVLVQANPALYAEMWPFLTQQVVSDVYLMVLAPYLSSFQVPTQSEHHHISTAGIFPRWC